MEPTPPQQKERIPSGQRLWFVWGVLVVMLLTVPFSMAQALTHRFNPTAENFKRWASRWAKSVLFFLGIRVRIEETVSLAPAQPYVFIANHQNSLDILALASAMPYPFGFVAKAELAQMPLIGFALRHSASILIDRRDIRRALESMQAAAQQIRNGNSVLIYPEGSRSFSSTVQPLKKGAFMLAMQAGVPLVPLVVINAFEHMDERTFRGKPGIIRIRVGTPIDSTNWRRQEIPSIMEKVRQDMQHLINEGIREA